MKKPRTVRPRPPRSLAPGELADASGGIGPPPNIQQQQHNETIVRDRKRRAR
jgi:hypothetical protein